MYTQTNIILGNVSNILHIEIATLTKEHATGRSYISSPVSARARLAHTTEPARAAKLRKELSGH